MRISTEQLTQQLARGLAPLYTVFGDEPLLALEATDRIRARARQDEYSEREVLTAEQQFDWSQLRIAAQSQSLFATRRILELRIPNGKPGVEGGKALQEFCAQLPAETITLIHLPEVDWRGQKSGWFETLQSAGVMVEAVQVKRDKLPDWLARRLKAQEQHADTETLEFIADKVEGNLLAAFQEVQKLALLFPPGKLAFDDVKNAVLDVARFDVFDLGGIVITGNAAHLARVLEGLRGEGAAPPLVLWAITEEIRAVGKLLAALSAGRAMPQALREARIWGPRQNLLQRHASRFTRAQVEAAIAHAARIDRLIKGLARGDVWDEFLQLGLRFARQ
jgi:DNA polymerase III subunit delta